MRNVTNEVKSALLSSFIPQTITLVLFVDEDNFDIIDVPASRIINDSMRINWTTSIGDELRFGTVIAPELDFTLDNADGRYTTSVYKGEKVRVYCSVTVDGTITEFNFGNFYIETVNKQGENLAVKALGTLVRMDKTYNTGDITFPITAWNFAAALCNLCELQLKPYDVGDYVKNMDVVLVTEPEGGKYTCRQLLSWVCEIMGVCADTTVVRGTENVRLRWMRLELSPFNESNMFSFSSEYTAVMPSGIIIIADDTISTGTDVTPYVIKNNVLMRGLNASLLQNIATLLDDSVQLMPVFPFTAETIPTPYLEPLDCSAFTRNGVYMRGAISSVTWSPNKNLMLKGVGFKKHEYDDFSPFTQKQDAVLDGMQTDISEHDTALDALNGRIDYLRDDLTTAQNDIGELDAAIDSFQTDGITVSDENRGIAAELTPEGLTVTDGYDSATVTADAVNAPAVYQKGCPVVPLAGANASIAANTDLNTLLTAGVYSVLANTTAETLQNAPTNKAGVLFVWYSNGSVSSNAYVIQEYRVFDNSGIYRRYCGMATGGRMFGAWKYDCLISPFTADFVVQNTTQNGWTMRKWNSGLRECWCVEEVTIPSGGMGAWGSVFFKSFTKNYPSDFFTDTPMLSATPSGGSTGLWTGMANPSQNTNTVAAFTVFRAVNTSANVTARIYLHAQEMHTESAAPLADEAVADETILTE